MSVRLLPHDDPSRADSDHHLEVTIGRMPDDRSIRWATIKLIARRHTIVLLENEPMTAEQAIAHAGRSAVVNGVDAVYLEQLEVRAGERRRSA